ncbi:ATP-binding protein [Hymenobacter persicinus]|uniref:ATP-binding protein n=1 Tax=Hymenobacter persicinus TaxID=2025506 RepID=UPI0013EAC88D|nr:ATP-binding protein [Hymenobacter persicinus]
MTQGLAQERSRRFEQAVRHFEVAESLYHVQRNPLGQAEALRHLGRGQYLQGDTSQARLTYTRALAGFARLHHTPGIAGVYEDLGQLYGAQQKWPRALSSYVRALATWQSLAQPASAARVLTSVGLAHREQRQYSRALYYLRQALRHGQQQHDSTRIREALAGMGGVYQAVGNQELALRFYEQALEHLQPRAAPEIQVELLQRLAATQLTTGQVTAAEQLLQKALPLARRSASKALLSSLYHQLADLYRGQGRYAQSLAALTRYAGLQDTVFAEERAAQVAEMQTRYETEKKERAIQLLTKDRQLQRANLQRQMLVRNVLGVGILLLLALAAGLYWSRRQQARINRLLQRKNAAISRQKEQLAHLNNTKDTLFSVISHDLRSPLSSLYSLLTLLNMGKLPPERLAAHSSRLSRGLDSTLRLLDNLLNWSAAQMRGSSVHPEALRLDTVVEEALALLLGDAERKTILLLNQIPVPTTASADLNMTRLIVRNLISNAIKFTPDGGTVTVSAARQGKWWEVAVADTGVGIAAADHAKVFGLGGPYSTLGTARERGTGLGLQLCKDFVERNGGRIYFESQPGVGTTFRFTLLAAQAEATPRPMLQLAGAPSAVDAE